MTTGTSIPLPPPLFGFGQKLEANGWLITYKEVERNSKPRHVLTARLSGNLVRVTYRPPADNQPEHLAFCAIPSCNSGSGRWQNFPDEEDFWEFTHTFDTGLLNKLPPIPAPPPKAVIPKQRCRCGKHKFSEEAAQRALLSAKIKRSLRGSQKRRECRIYPCPGESGVHHLTSQP